MMMWLSVGWKRCLEIDWMEMEDLEGLSSGPIIMKSWKNRDFSIIFLEKDSQFFFLCLQI